MTNFQLLTVIPLGLLAFWDLMGCLRQSDRRVLRTVRFVTWFATAVAIANPKLVQRVATVIGIDRGTNLVLYSFVILMMILVFYFYARQADLQRQITELVRHEAVSEAERGGTTSSNQPAEQEEPAEQEDGNAT